ncbi:MULTISPECIES: TonB-dependent receptor [Acinetobacter]|uniref:TonB-dependent receptor n=1 Tax=Acinetobacter entericus TaxID=2989714 RepID=A0ABT3NEJ9_9GAMM|nr:MULTISPECIES: TonB-dependent receptor [Acinetobacter]MCW8037985.1 TonB-dependent receptor [Acinetobacter entericus]TCB76347.1 TonB-dependent receptor [Acinetobacter sp. ANC 4177]
MKRMPSTFKLSALTLSLCALSMPAWAEDTSPAVASSAPAAVQTLPTMTFQVEQAPAVEKNPDISAVAKTIITRDEMEKFGDQSVNDALRRAAGFQMPTPGQGPRGGNGSMRFRGGGAPVFLINGEPVQGGPRGGMSVVDSITPDMIERIEIVKQPSVAQASVASSAVINIILKEPLDGTRISGTVRAGYGIAKSSQKEEERKNISLQMDGKTDPWTYSLSANQMWSDSDSVTTTENASGIMSSQKRITNRTSQMLSPRAEYSIDDQQKLVAELFYRNNESQGSMRDQIQEDKNDSIRLNTRYERKDKGNSDKIRLSVEQQNETELTRSSQRQSYTDEQINEYGLAYDGVRKFDETKQIKFGTDLRSSELEGNTADTLDEQRYALYAEGSWRFTPRQSLTLGARQEWIHRSGLVDYSDSHLSPVLVHRFDFTNSWSLQTNISQAFRSPKSDQLLPAVSVSTDIDAGSLNNPDQGGNPFLRPEKINAYESTLGYNTSTGGVNITAYYREINDYIEKAIRSEDAQGQSCATANAPSCRFVERPFNQDNATTYGVEVAGRYALKQTEAGHSFMLNAQLSTVRAKIEEDNGTERLASDVAPYTASAGLSYNYQPWRVSSSLNVNYTPAYTRELNSQDYNGELYERTSNERVNVDLSITKRFDNNWAASINARNIFSTDYKERLTKVSDGSLYQARSNESIPSLLLSVEKKF